MNPPPQKLPFAHELFDLCPAMVRVNVTTHSASVEITTPADWDEETGHSPAQTVGLYLNVPVWRLRDILNAAYEHQQKLLAESKRPST